MAYLYKIKLQMQVYLTYRFEVFASIATHFILILANVFLWNCVYSDQKNISGVGRGQMITYSVLSSCLAVMYHEPEILFLDEPTIGLDIDAKQAIRDFILEMNRRKKTTVILTSHDLDDVMKLCTRLIVINKGVIVEDGPIDEIVSRMATYRMLVVEVAEPVQSIASYKVEIMKIEGRKIWCKFDHHIYTAAEIIHALGQEMKIVDLSVREPDVEDAISNIYHA